jgi:hypothetical protein
MTSESSTGEWCEWIGCELEAWYRVRGQWSLFDWMDFCVCSEHLERCEAWFAHRLVDGRPVLELETITLPIRDDVAG